MTVPGEHANKDQSIVGKIPYMKQRKMKIEF